MADFETYEATADAKRAKEVAATTSPFKIKVRFLGGLNARQKSAFKKAADRWTLKWVVWLQDLLMDYAFFV